MKIGMNQAVAKTQNTSNFATAVNYDDANNMIADYLPKPTFDEPKNLHISQPKEEMKPMTRISNYDLKSDTKIYQQKDHSKILRSSLDRKMAFG